MDIVIEFFRDTLDGPFYIIWVVVLVILIFACIGYLAEKGIKNKKEKEKYATVSDVNNTEVVQETVVSDVNNTAQVESTSVTTSITEPVSNAPVVEEVPTSVTDSTGISQNDGVSEPVVQPVNSSVIVDNTSPTPTVSEVATNSSLNDVDNGTTSTEDLQVENVIPQVEVSQTNNVVNPQIESVSTDKVNAPSNEVSQVAIPTINQDGNNNTV